MLEKKQSRVKVILIVLVVIWLDTTFPMGQAQTGKVDYLAELNKLGMEGRAESDDAAPFYQKAGELYVKFSQQQPYPTLKGWPANLPEKELSELKNWVAANSKALEQLELGSKKPYCWFRLSSPDGSLYSVLIPDLAEYKNLCRAITERAKLSAAQGNMDKAIADIVTCYRFGLHMQMGGPKVLVEQLVGIAARALTLQTTFDILDRTKVDKVLLKTLQGQIEQLSTDETYIPDFRAEKFARLDFIQRVFTDDGKGDGQIDLQSAKEVLPILNSSELDDAKVLALIGGRGRRQMTDETEKMYEYLGEVVRKTPWQQKADKINPDAEVAKITKGDLSVSSPALVRVGELLARCRADTEGLITTLAVLRYKADKGQLPEKLDELVKTGHVKTLASDPFSGKPFVYRPTGENFTLYSFGPNLIDEGGKVGLDTKGQPKKWADNGDTVFWPVSSGQSATSADISGIFSEDVRSSTDKNLRGIGIALKFYSSGHAGKFPPSLDELVKEGTLLPQALESPRKPAGFNGPSYIYISGQATAMPPGDILVYENPEFCSGEIKVLFVNYYVGVMKPDAFLRRLEATCKWLGRKMPEIKFASAVAGQSTQPADERQSTQKPAQQQTRPPQPRRSTRRRQF